MWSIDAATPRRRRQALALVVLLVAATVVRPVGVFAAPGWQVSRSPASVAPDTPTEVTVRAKNVGGSSTGDDIGCLKITVHTAFAVSSVRIVSVSGGKSWTVSYAGSPTVVTAQAVSGGDRLKGGSNKEEVTVGITVSGSVEGTYQWSADAHGNTNCSSNFNQLKTFEVDIASVTPPNEAPVATADAYSVHAGSTLDVAPLGVLANDTDGNGDPLVAELLTSPANGALSFPGDGAFTYTPSGAFVGTDSFTYRASDGTDVSGSVTVTITVTNTAPVAADDAATVSKNVLYSASAPGLLGNDSDADGDGIAAALLTPPSNGTASVAADGSWSYDPDPGFVGSDSFVYEVSDGFATDTGTVSLTVVNNAPAAADDTYAIGKNLLLVVGAPGVLGNDSDANGDGLSASVVSGPSNGVLLLQPDGSFTYTPSLGFTGTDTFTYGASDGTATSVATVTIGVTNGAPVAVDDTASVIHDRDLTVAAPGVLGNDADPNGDALTAALATMPGNGTVVLDPDGGYVYTPDPGFVGVDSFTYTVSDGTATDTATVTVTVTNAAPTATADAGTVKHDRSLTVAAPGVLGNDTDPDGDPLTAVLVTPPANGALTLDGDGGYVYTPDAGFVGTDSFQYLVDDGAAQSAVATVALTVTNAAPVPVADAKSVGRNGTVTVSAPGVLGNDVDADGDALVATLVSPPLNGTLSFDANGGYTYTPDAGFVGTDAFSYSVSDGIATAGPVTVSLSVVNTAPVAVADSASVVHDRSLVVAAPGVLGNDVDADGDPLTASVVAGPANGSLSLAASGAYTYVPDPGFVGIDSFTYAASDGVSASVPTAVAITVTNVPPVAVGDTATATAGVTLTVPAPGVLGNDTDADGDPVTAFVVTLPAHGTLSLAADGGWTYLAEATYAGPDSFTYRAWDGASWSDRATVLIDVDPAPAPSPSPTPQVTATPGPTATPEPSATPDPSVTPEPTGSPEPTGEPEPGPSGTPSPPSPEPSPDLPGAVDPGAPDTFSVGSGSETATPFSGLTGLAFAGLSMEWAVPALALAVPGLLLVIALGAQALGALAWLPVARRSLAGVGIRRRGPTAAHRI